jgi:hypothetical protein
MQEAARVGDQDTLGPDHHRSFDRARRHLGGDAMDRLAARLDDYTEAVVQSILELRGSEQDDDREDQRQSNQIAPIRGSRMPKPAAEYFSMLLHGGAPISRVREPVACLN